MIINIIINKTADCEDQKIYELEFIGMAENNGMKTGALKSANNKWLLRKKYILQKR